MVTMLSKQVSNNDNDDNGDDDDDNDDTSWWRCCRSSYRRRHRVWGQGVIQRCIEGLRLRLSIFVIMLFASVIHGEYADGEDDSKDDGDDGTRENCC